jgi:hypothetical protein
MPLSYLSLGRRKLNCHESGDRPTQLEPLLAVLEIPRGDGGSKRLTLFFMLSNRFDHDSPRYFLY